MTMIPRQYVVRSRWAFAERRPYDGTWTWLARSLTHATKLASLPEALAVARALADAVAIVTVADGRVVAEQPLIER